MAAAKQGGSPKSLIIRVTGTVQGVGFRPFIYSLATDMGLRGTVTNTSEGVIIEVEGEGADLFAGRMRAGAPPLARIDEVRVTPGEVPLSPQLDGFSIRESTESGSFTLVSPDVSTCADCMRELADPSDRRFGYPFINCTNCGPRYSITERVPYDRPHTTMADFAMCTDCAAEYARPGDRRFHAQPIACAVCGPSCWLVDPRGKQIVCADPIAEAAQRIRAGRIVAIKGLGGFHIACRADDEHVVARLRRRKSRDAKPFALMVRDMDQGRLLCRIDPAAEELLTGPLRPIVLLPRLPDARLAEPVAPGLSALGIMLPYTPLHHLLMGFDLPPLVMTSGNVSDEPLIRLNEDAVAHLAPIADAILLHNRGIQRSVDDSVVQARASGAVVLRRGRGYAPQPVIVGDRPSPVILAVGAELKNAVCLYRDGRAVLSEHIGDLTDGRVYRRFMQVINDLENLFDLRPEAVAADLHPQYLSTEYALRRGMGQLAGRPALPIVRVQHHHAHIVACMAENGYAGDVIGIACDGVGYGPDGEVWGCEILHVSLASYFRLGHLRQFPLPGGDAAAIETARPALAMLLETFGRRAVKLPAARGLFEDPARGEQLAEQIAAGINCPRSSSLGRLFDAVAALCGVARANQYEGQGPMMLESVASAGVDRAYPFELS
ncbi:hypothetical protein LCGC14_1557660, partial [marine sediment metagenome]